jgi:pimeloyl-ACP methyl ester carboxylesterase
MANSTTRVRVFREVPSHDVAGVMDALRVPRADFVTHDIGNMVGYTVAAGYPHPVTRFVPIDRRFPE